MDNVSQSAAIPPRDLVGRVNLRLRAILKVLGVIMVMASLTKVPSIVLGLALGEAAWRPFAHSFLVGAMVGLAVWWPHRHVRYELRLRDGFLIVNLTWICAALVAVPPLMTAAPHLSFTHAFFEVMSALTTTGATVISGLDALPRSVLLYRHVLQMFGGMGIVILAIAILPMLRVGGTQLFRAETTGPSRDSKLTPRIAETAKALWLVYVGLIVLCALSYWVVGMDLFDAVCHAMSTISTGGFSTHDAAFDHWNNPLLDCVGILFMVLGGTNFALHFLSWQRANVAAYGRDSEFKAYLLILLCVSLLVSWVLWWSGSYDTASESVRKGTFQIVSAMTNTGFTVGNFDRWPGITPLLAMLVAIVGGSSGSTSGGLKVVRVVMALRQGMRELRQLVHPHGQFLVKLGGQRVSGSVILSVSGFITLWLACLMALTLGMIAAGLDMVSAFGGAVTTMTNMGPGLGSVTFGFGEASDAAIWLGNLGMLLGRLEVFAVLVLLTPTFWRD